jgi:GT2 family glycosyltransferase
MIHHKNSNSKFSILIPFHHRHDLLFSLLKELNNYSVLVVDDGPLPTPFNSSIDYIRSENVGFSKAVNNGLAHLEKRGFTQVLLLNDDAKITPSDIEKLLKQTSNQTILAPTILCNGKRIYGVSVKSWGRVKANLQRSSPIDAVFGTCMLLPSNLRFDEGFPHGFEDIELCQRAKKMGFTIKLVEDALCIHQGESSLSRNDKKGQRASVYGQLRLFSSLKKSPLITGLCFAQIVREKGNIERYVGFSKGVVDWYINDIPFLLFQIARGKNSMKR